MSENPVEVVTFVAGDHVVQFEVRKSDQIHGWVDVRVTLDYGPTWRYNEPGWRPLSVGAAVDRFYWWSARHLVLLPSDVNGTPEALDVDEDILLVFAIDINWLIVCESSVRLIESGRELSRLELSDVILEARWRGAELVVLNASHQLVQIVISEGRLVANS